jgi:hypothetical protein
VELYPGQDGMATLVATSTATDATACFGWLTRLRRCGPLHPEPTPDHGLPVGRLSTGRHAAPTSRVPPAAALRLPGSLQRQFPITTLMGIGDEPAELAGTAPIPAHLARQIAADPNSTWQRLLTDPASGRLLDIGRTRYRPPPGMAAFVRARDGECRHPTCRRTASACELDHVTSGSTAVTPARTTSARCARATTTSRNTTAGRSSCHHDRSLEWTTPTGHRYTSLPVDHRIPHRSRVTSPADAARSALSTAALLTTPVDDDGTAPF